MEVVIIKVAVIGSRSLIIEDCEKYIPDSVTEIVSGGAKGVDMCARKFAVENGIKLKEFPPDYKKYGKGAPLRRNLQIIEYADYNFLGRKIQRNEICYRQCKEARKRIHRL